MQWTVWVTYVVEIPWDVDSLSTSGQRLLEDVEIARKLWLRTVVAFQTEGAVQAVLCSAPDVPERNLL